MRKISFERAFLFKKFMIQANIPVNKGRFSCFKTKASLLLKGTTPSFKRKRSLVLKKPVGCLYRD